MIGVFNVQKIRWSKTLVSTGYFIMNYHDHMLEYIKKRLVYWSVRIYDRHNQFSYINFHLVFATFNCGKIFISVGQI